MPLNLTYYYNGSFPYFEFKDDITVEELKDLLNILEELIEKEKQFVFVLDATEAKSIPTFKGGYYVLNWMSRNYSKIPNVLLASAIISTNETMTNLLNWIFNQKKPVSPNFMTDDRDKAIEFVKERLPENLKIKSM